MTSKVTVMAASSAFVIVASLWLLLRRQKRQHRRAQQLASLLAEFSVEAEVAIVLALKCGDAMRDCVRGKVEWKDADGIDPVTQTDQDNEVLVTKGLLAAFPGHLVIGEEAAAGAKRIPPLRNDAPTWIVDPIDGTQNFTHGARLSAVSIGLCVEGHPVLGVVYDPYADEVFVGARGQGSFCNGDPIRVDDSVTTLQRALVGCDVGYDRSSAGIAKMTSGFSELLKKRTQSLRILGSSVLSLVWVACGRANAFVIGAHDEGGKPWDYCAAFVIATEAGALFRRLDNRSYNDDDDDDDADKKKSSSGAAKEKEGKEGGADDDSDNSSWSTLEELADFDIYSKSCVCAGTPELAEEISEAFSAYYDSEDSEDSEDEQMNGFSAADRGVDQDWGVQDAPFKMLLLVNQELFDAKGKPKKMTAGKTAAQCGHATLGAYKRGVRKCPGAVKAWEYTGQAKIAVKCPTEAGLLQARDEAARRGVGFYLVCDAGHTQIAPDSKTVLAIGPAPVAVLDEFTREFKLY
eukprot:CAMPEP_0171752652 /NCGR_PEP_ID=MMETSP0991-20121206/42756_1 /TAXON_ID=483369 /ORGANISM="non described non described, Strain CCMP2098" /LENGTH=518 /DNA_ID=CAMNT_0012354101 /DNA_START=39 /DNA_END=1595 /DNA_ORIENTATION=-